MTKLGMRRTIPQLPLKRRKGLNKMSIRAHTELEIWLAVKEARMFVLQDRFGYIPCEYCQKPINYSSELFYPEGHHLDHNRRHNEPTNCRIVHRACNQFIEDKNVRDVVSLL